MIHTSRPQAVVFCRYYLSEKATWRKVRTIRRHVGSLAKIIIVDNKREIGLAECADEGRTVVWHGSNSLFDLTAYREGYEKLKEDNLSSILFLNDTLFLKYPSRYILKKILNSSLRANGVTVPMCVGIAGSYGYFLQCNPWSTTSIHLSTFAFWANRAAAEHLVELVDLVHQKWAEVSKLDRRTWHSEMEGYFGHRFYAYLGLVHFSGGRAWKPLEASGLGGDNEARKAFCYFAEHQLTAAVINANGGFVFVNSGRERIVYSLLAILASVTSRIRALHWSVAT